MEKLAEFKLSDCILNDNELESLKGGAFTYYCARTKRNSDGSYTTYTFTTGSYNLARSWAGMWEAHGWYVKIGSVRTSAEDNGSWNLV